MLTHFYLAFITMTGLSYINFLPGLVNALAGSIGFSDVEAGQIVALNGYGGLIGSAIAIFMVRRIRWQPVIFSCLLLLGLMDIATVLIDDVSFMLGWRFLSGVFGGLALGMAFALLARLDSPDRAFGTLLFVQFSIGSLVMFLLPGLEVMISTHAVFYVMASFSLLSLLFMLLLPTRDLNRQPIRPVMDAASPMRREDCRHAVLLLSAIIGYQVAASAIWAYVGLIGIAAEIAYESVNTYIAITGLLGLLGAVFPIVLGSRYGRLNWLMAGMALSITAAILLNFAQQSLLYVIAMALLFFSWPAVQSYLLAVTAALDCSGRLSTIAAVVSSVGLATGPLLASALLDNGNFSMMLYTCVIIFLLSCLLLLKPVQAQEKPVSATLLSPSTFQGQ
ncbi:MAG: MFS transporter [Nitrincola lacisaponensis]|uniref:MFS transporter n=1 Tax=Nitrincola lacisaponensis TaxID=267850 RepID=UPI00391CAEAE